MFGLLTNQKLFAQTYSFSILAGETNSPIAYAHIQVEGTLYGAVSDGDGRCKIQIQAKDLDGQLIISYMGFQSLSIPIAELKRDEPNFIQLKESEIQLAEFKVIDIGVSPQEFLQQTIDLADKTFYTKDYTGLATYEEQIIEDDEPNFNYSMEVLIEAQGFRTAKGKNKYVGNDKAYLINVSQLWGSQKYSLISVAELIQFTFPFDKPEGDDTYFTQFFTLKNTFEKALFIDSKMVFTGDWFFEDLYSISEEIFVKVTKVSAGSRVSFEIDRNTYHIRSIEVISPYKDDGNLMRSYTRGDVNFRIDYFKVEGKSYLKSVEIVKQSSIKSDSVNLTKQNRGKLVFHRLVDEKPDKKMEIDEQFIREKIYK
ncbi:carboxypeptidase-like regulatory domain-containing protein [Algoriphagus winogradskyi]|uniref:CarboxypepD_reg-like domain-containing protein n=1 Tax=Algoriphagus winogradskyi TaxID=237017 RepID=A0ABY1PAJ1_9BACT|nr:carboxypeptidase-like regulatory domain-containing protein [Algoriphagus winogradskyi]SMP30194.1 CarboxypepD_reg-like domain-containing protein [Algoriphagus winogradskyi]